jgi:ligand-binding sensor domain-containing protein
VRSFATLPGRRWVQSVGLTLLWFVLLPDQALALDPGRNLLQYSCQTWHRQNGLPVKAINSLAQTRDGYLWLGTRAGLVRFDGSEFKLTDSMRTADARSGIVTSLAAARNGGLWVGQESGALGFYDERTFSVRTKESPDIAVRGLGEGGDGLLWFACNNGIFRLTPAGTNEPLLVDSAVVTNQLNILGGCGLAPLSKGSIAGRRGKSLKLPIRNWTPRRFGVSRKIRRDNFGPAPAAGCFATMPACNAKPFR